MLKRIGKYVLSAVGVGLIVGGPAWAAEKGTPVTLTVRVVDAVCMLPMGQKGESHRECAIACDKAGVRASLLDEKANVMYAVMADGPLKDPNALLRAHLEREVKVKGDLYTGPGGLKIVAVKEVKPI